jgi:ADP-ribose pyrophosphatase
MDIDIQSQLFFLFFSTALLHAMVLSSPQTKDLHPMNTRDHRTLFTGLVVDIEQIDVMVGSRGWHPYQVVRHPGGAAALPLHEDGSVTLIRQLRPAVKMNMLEIPAGRLSPDEPPQECAARELLEETGLRAERLESLGIIHPSPGVFDEVIHLFLARGLTQGEAEPEAYEEIEAVRMPLAKAMELVMNGEITDGKTIAALARTGMGQP